MALSLIGNNPKHSHHGNTLSRDDYALLDGGGYFGGGKKFRVSLYEECEKTGINLLALSKNSPILHDEKGRDFMATTGILASYPVWVYSYVQGANKEENLYGNISVVKLSGDSPRVFRCDVMDYLDNCDLLELLSPLTFVSEDPRCLGYPIPCILLTSSPRHLVAMLLHYHDQIENILEQAGFLDVLRREESTCSFADELHGAKHAFNLSG
jgi:hypothetical protein